MRVKRLVILLLFVAFSILSYSQRNSKFIDDSLWKIRAYDSLIVWDKNRKLTVSDFQGLPDTASAANAVSVCNFIPVYDKINPPYRSLVICVFEKKSSWAKPNTLNVYTLLHEQCHFDIVEVYARKMTKMINKIPHTTPKRNAIVQHIFDSLSQEHTRMQDEFDRETSCAIDSTKQQQWVHKIKELL